MCYLSKLWEYIQRKQVDVAVPSLILRNYRYRNELSVIWQVKKPQRFMSIREIHGKLREFVDEFVPNMQSRLIHYPGERPLFDLYNVEEDIQKHCKHALL